ncbi:LysR family transcriptional regulator [[Pseudomonas] boreopolis]|uniref:LysR family transcriptional regulator n=1 Tax=Xanthomonas boreopolis TaxID=86183 RepID=A0A919F8J6_9XANT|nr:LysR family transcriptional regulator [[Pseudomonas] boreopolis]
MELVWLEDCVALAATLNFSRAAEARHVTQPAFSRRIRALEQWLGVALFARSTHGVELTEAGEFFCAQAQALARDLNRLRRETLEIAGKDVQALTFAATHALSFTFFPLWIRRRENAGSLGRFNLVSDTTGACERMMAQGSAQFLLCHFHRRMQFLLRPPAFLSVVVGNDVLMPVSAPDATGRARWRVDGDDGRYLAYSAESGLGRILASAAGHAGRRPAFVSDLAATLLAMVRSGEGLAWIPRTLAEDDLAQGRVVAAGPASSQVPIEIRVFRPAARLSPAAETLWSAIAEGA